MINKGSTAGEWRNFHFSFLGSFDIQNGDHQLVLSKSEIIKSLFAYLIIENKGNYQRSRLAGQFWPNKTESEALKSLSQAVFSINKTIPNFITMDKAELFLPFEIYKQTDHYQFTNLLNFNLNIQSINDKQADSINMALELYKGEFLHGIYDDWVSREQAILSLKYERALELLLNYYKMKANWQKAMELAFTLYYIDSLDERINYDIINLYFLWGKNQKAIDHYKKYKKALEKELDSSPSNDIEELIAKIKLHHSNSPQAYSRIESKSPEKSTRRSGINNLLMIGRDREKEELLTLIENKLFSHNELSQENSLSQSFFIFLEGSPGIGKTRLLKELSKDVKWRGGRILETTCSGAQGVFPFNTIKNLLTPHLTFLTINILLTKMNSIWLQILSTLIPAIKEYLPGEIKICPVDFHKDKERIMEAILEVFRTWSVIEPLLIIFDDLHLVDGDTMEVLNFLARRLNREKLVFICSFRAIELKQNDFLKNTVYSIKKNNTLKSIILEGLDQDATALLINIGLGLNCNTTHLSNTLYKKSGGNPLFIILSLKEVYEKSMMINQESNGELFIDQDVGFQIPGSIQKMIQNQVERLDEEQKGLLEIIVILGKYIDIDLLHTLCSLQAENIITILNIFCYWGFLSRTNTGYTFSHGTIFHSIEQLIPKNKQIAIHRKAYRFYKNKHPYQVERIAHHSLSGKLWKQAVNYHYLSAVHAFKNYSNHTAFFYCNRGLCIIDEESIKAPHLLFKLLVLKQKISWVMGKKEEQSENIDRIKRQASIIDKYACYMIYNQLDAEFKYHILNDPGRAVVAARQAIEFAGKNKIVKGVLKASVLVSDIYKVQNKLSDAKKVINNALELVPGDVKLTMVVFQLYYNLIIIHIKMGELDETDHLCHILGKRVKRKNNPEMQSRYYSLLGRLNYVRGDYEKSINCYENALTNIQVTGIRLYEAKAFINLAAIYINVYKFEKALENQYKALEILEDINYKPDELICLYGIGYIYRHIGIWDLAEQSLEKALIISKQLNFYDWQLSIGTEMIQMHLDRDQIEKALIYKTLLKEIKDFITPRNMFKFFFSRAIIYYYQKKYKSVILNLQKMEKSLQSSFNKPMIALANSYLAMALLKTKKEQEALFQSTESVKIIESFIEDENSYLIYYHHYRILSSLGQDALGQFFWEKAYLILEKQLSTMSNEEWKISFMNNPPIHRDIYSNYKKEIRKDTITVLLPLKTAPNRGKLKDGYMKEVELTIYSDEDKDIISKKLRRIQVLIRILHEAEIQNTAPAISDLEKILQINARTIKRYLSELRNRGFVLNTRGSL